MKLACGEYRSVMACRYRQLTDLEFWDSSDCGFILLLATELKNGI
jgi:hypothetical protein